MQLYEDTIRCEERRINHLHKPDAAYAAAKDTRLPYQSSWEKL